MKGFAITQPRQIAVLASPTRQDIVDTVTAIGPCSIAEVADALDRPADGLYFHVRRLMAAGLLLPVGTREGAERGALRVDVPKRQMHLEYEPGNAQNRTAVLRVIGSMLRGAERTFRHGMRPGLAVTSGPRRNLWAGRSRGALSAGELKEVNRLLVQLATVMRRGRSDRGRGRGKRTLYEVSFVLAPARQSRRA
jgi:hypothetical protein